MSRKFKVSVSAAIIAVSMIALTACSGGVPSGFTEKVVDFDSGSFAINVPDEWHVAKASEYTPNEDSYWVSNLKKDEAVGVADNPGVVVIYRDLDEEASAETVKNFNSLPDELLGSEYKDLATDESFKVKGAAQSTHISGIKDGLTIDIVASLSDDKDTLALVMVNYIDKDMKFKDVETITNSFEFRDTKK